MKQYDKKYVVTFLILNYKTYQDTIVLAKELMSYNGYGSKYGVVIVDNASPNESWKELNNYLGGQTDLYLLLSAENGGYAKGNNVGLRYIEQCPPDYVCIINNDVHFTEEVIEHLCNVYESISDVGMMSPVQIHPNGKQLATRLDLPSFCRDLHSLLPFTFGKTQPWEYKSNTEKDNLMCVDIIPGAFVFISYSIMQSIGFYDEATFLFCEERFLTMKLHNAKRNNYILLDRTYLHQHSLTISSEASELRQRKMLFDGKVTFTRYYRTHPRLKVFLMQFVNTVSLPIILLRYRLVAFLKKIKHIIQ